MLAEVAKGLNYLDLDVAVRGRRRAPRVGLGGRGPHQQGAVRRRPRPGADPGHGPPEPSPPVAAAAAPGVHVEGLDDVMVRLSRCCTPVPGDDIIGFVTRGRGVSVHRADCANAVSLASAQGDRLIDVEWDNENAGEFVASIEVKALDRSRLLQDVIAVLSDNQANIIACSTNTGGDRVAKMRLDFELSDPTQLDRIVAAIRGIDAVYDAFRLLPGRAHAEGKRTFGDELTSAFGGLVLADPHGKPLGQAGGIAGAVPRTLPPSGEPPFRTSR